MIDWDIKTPKIEVLSKKRMSSFNKKLKKKQQKNIDLSSLTKVILLFLPQITLGWYCLWMHSMKSWLIPHFFSPISFLPPHKEHYSSVFLAVHCLETSLLHYKPFSHPNTYIFFIQILFCLLPNYVMKFFSLQICHECKMTLITNDGHNDILTTHLQLRKREHKCSGKMKTW